MTTENWYGFFLSWVIAFPVLPYIRLQVFGITARTFEVILLTEKQNHYQIPDFS